jgi:alkaline phosphatase D
MPADVSYDANSSSIDAIQIYRSFQFGSLAQLAMTDERLYRADHTSPRRRGLEHRLALHGAGQPSPQPPPPRSRRHGRRRGRPAGPVSMLGTTQRAWWRTR